MTVIPCQISAYIRRIAIDALQVSIAENSESKLDKSSNKFGSLDSLNNSREARYERPQCIVLIEG